MKSLAFFLTGFFEKLYNGFSFLLAWIFLGVNLVVVVVVVVGGVKFETSFYGSGDCRVGERRILRGRDGFLRCIVIKAS